jgi:hypothetical protein|tara:strand:+ start:3236 stop:5386 length:2151 start_codon:yes stop_codon:yes gene_type:complete
MAFTREQAFQMFRARMAAIAAQNAQKKQEEAERERDERLKQDEFWGTLNLAAGAAKIPVNIYDRWHQKLIGLEYGGPEEITIAGAPKKYKTREGFHPFKPVEETEGYTKFKADKIKATKQLEERSKELLRKPPEVTGVATSRSTFEDPYKNVVLGAEEESAFIVESQKASDIQMEVMREEELSEISGFLEEQQNIKQSLVDIENAKFNQYGLTKVRAEELADILEGEGITLPAGMTEEKTLELLASFDKVPMGDNPVGALATNQPEYRAFVDTLKSGNQNPDTFQSVVTDLTTNTDETIQSVIDGIYAPEVEDVSTTTSYSKLEGKFGGIADPEISQKMWYIQTIEGDPSKRQQILDLNLSMEELDRHRQAGTNPLDDSTKGGGIDFVLEKLKKDGTEVEIPDVGMPPEVAIPDAYVPDTSMKKVFDYEGTNEELLEKLGLDPKSIPKNPRLQKAALDEALENLEAGTIDGEIPDLPEGGPLTASADWMPMEASEDIEQVSTDILPEAPTVPDAKPGVVGKAFDAGQTALQLSNIGRTLADAEATDEEKGIASLQGTKLLADIAAKKAGQETVSQIGSKAATQFIKGKGLQEGAKLTGKQAVGAAAGGVLGGYTMITEGKAAGESWEEGDYDEAILHGIGSASGGLQTAGAGMMATGVGAPLGAVLYGIGTAGSVISSVGTFLEGLFGEKEEVAEAPRPKFNASSYLNSIRRERLY